MAGDIRYWVVIPAAGVGRRMQAKVPKQYLTINNKTILEHTLGLFSSHPKIAGLVLVLSPEDNIWATLDIDLHPNTTIVQGGKQRCHSVLNGLCALSNKACVDDWVLVHDAVRPCVNREDIDRLMDTLCGHEVGGLLGIPVRDTIKRVDKSYMLQETLACEGLWHALTPQMFRFDILLNALKNALSEDHLVKDEAQAIQLSDLQVRMVKGCPKNIKITDSHDLALAQLYLSCQQAMEA